MDNETVDGTLKSTLDALGVPVSRLYYKGDANTFITFQLVTGRDRAFCDDDNEVTEYIYRVDIYSKSDFIALLRRAKQALKEAGFYGVSIDPEVYEPDTCFYHVPLEIKFMEE